MKCDKSFKRHMLTTWGMHEIAKGRTLEEVRADINTWMRKTTEEVKAMVVQSAKNRTGAIAERVAKSLTAEPRGPWKWTIGTLQAFITGPETAWVGVTSPKYGREVPVVNNYEKKCLDLAVKMLNNDWAKGIQDTSESKVKAVYRKAEQRIPWKSGESWDDSWTHDAIMRSGMNTARVVERIVASYAQVAFNPMRGLHLDRGFYVPKDVDVEKITPEGTDLDIRVYTKNGVLYGVAFQGKANRPLWNYRFRDRAQLDRQIAETVENRRGHAELMQKRQEERSQFSHTLKEGDILYSSWGYDQTNIDFYQVTAIGGRSVKIRPIEQKIVGESTGSEQVVAVPGRFTGPDQTKMVRPGNTLRLTSYSSAYPWDGKPKHQTAFGYGH